MTLATVVRWYHGYEVRRGLVMVDWFEFDRDGTVPECAALAHLMCREING